MCMFSPEGVRLSASHEPAMQKYAVTLERNIVMEIYYSV